MNEFSLLNCSKLGFIPALNNRFPTQMGFVLVGLGNSPPEMESLCILTVLIRESVSDADFSVSGAFLFGWILPTRLFRRNLFYFAEYGIGECDSDLFLQIFVQYLPAEFNYFEVEE